MDFCVSNDPKANNPLWIIRNTKIHKDLSHDSFKENTAEQGDFKLYEVRPDAQPIGKFDHAIPYTTQEIELLPGDAIYIFSDGYADQFGGEKGKKFKTVNFKKLLLSIQHLPIQKQSKALNDTFEEWRKDYEQVDDVCIIGLKV